MTEPTNPPRLEAGVRTVDHALHARKMDAIARLAGAVAHDFNNTLAVINAYASMLALSPELGDVDRRRAGEIVDAIERATLSTQRLLSFGRRRMTPPPRLDVAATVRAMGPTLRRGIPVSIELDVRISEQPALVSIDGARLEQVVLDLIDNAIEAMPAGGRLEVALEIIALDDEHVGSHMTVRPGWYALLTVRDTGVGMDDATLSRLFEPYFTTKQSVKGAGLGLASVYATVTQAGGYVSVDSEPTRGTTFSIYLPLAAEATSTSPEQPEVALLDRTDFARVLLVEDDEQLRPAMVRLLEDAGYTVIEAANGEVALDVLATQADTVDLLITDLATPGGGWRELGEVVARDYRELRILLTSGYIDDRAANPDVLKPRRAFLRKPFTREQLLGAIDQALAAE